MYREDGARLWGLLVNRSQTCAVELSPCSTFRWIRILLRVLGCCRQHCWHSIIGKVSIHRIVCREVSLHMVKRCLKEYSSLTSSALDRTNTEQMSNTRRSFLVIVSSRLIAANSDPRNISRWGLDTCCSKDYLQVRKPTISPLLQRAGEKTWTKDNFCFCVQSWSHCHH